MTAQTLPVLDEIIRIKAILANVRNLSDILEIRDRAVAAQAWASARGADEAAMLAMEVKLRAERKAGQFLADMKDEGILHRGGNPKTKAQDVTLASIGVERIESQRWQRIASIPESQFENYLSRAKEKTQSALLRIAEELDAEVNGDYEPFEYQLYNVWPVFQLDPRYGTDYPGRTPHQIIVNLLYYYTIEGDLVVDPFAGGGTTIDVCKRMNRRCRAFDLKPSRPEIEENDSLLKIPVEDVMLVFLDPPYYDLIPDYIQNEFNQTYGTFIKAMRQTFENILPILKPGGKVALMLKPMNEKMLEGDWLDMTFDSVKLAKELGYHFMKRISVPLSTQQFSATDVVRAKEERAMLNTLRDIVVLEGP